MAGIIAGITYSKKEHELRGKEMILYVILSGLVSEMGKIVLGLVVLARSRGRESVVRDFDSF